MKARPLKRVNQEFVDCSIEEVEYLELKFPCILEKRILPVILKGKREGSNNWTWNGDINFPTLKPSISTKQSLNGELVVCHSFVNDGIVEFLSDSTHDKSNMKISLLDIPSS